MKESYTGVLLFFVVAPAAALLAPHIVTYTLVAAIAAFYVSFIFRKPRRRCVPCGEIVPLGPIGFLKAITGKLECPHCGSNIKNSHRA